MVRAQRLLIALLAWSLVLTSPAHAYEADRNQKTEGTSSGGSAEVRSTQAERSGARPVSRRRNRPNCDYDRIESLPATVPTSMLEDRPGQVDALPALLDGRPEGTRVYNRICPSGTQLVIIEPRVRQAIGQDFAIETLDSVGPPPSSIKFNPESRGLVGIESWFWIEGYDGAPIVQSFVHPEFVPPITITIELTYRHTSWDFGDNTTLTGDLGRAYPQESSVRHSYDRDSRNTPYTVTATLVFVARYSVNGGPWTEIGTVERDVTGQHAVIAAEAVRTR